MQTRLHIFRHQRSRLKSGIFDGTTSPYFPTGRGRSTAPLPPQHLKSWTLEIFTDSSTARLFTRVDMAALKGYLWHFVFCQVLNKWIYHNTLFILSRVCSLLVIARDANGRILSSLNRVTSVKYQKHHSVTLSEKGPEKSESESFPANSKCHPAKVKQQ